MGHQVICFEADILATKSRTPPSADPSLRLGLEEDKNSAGGKKRLHGKVIRQIDWGRTLHRCEREGVGTSGMLLKDTAPERHTMHACTIGPIGTELGQCELCDTRLRVKGDFKCCQN